MVRIEARRSNFNEFDLSVLVSRMGSWYQVHPPSSPNIPYYDCAADAAGHEKIVKFVQQHHRDGRNVREAIGLVQIYLRVGFHSGDLFWCNHQLPQRVVIICHHRHIVRKCRLEVCESLQQLLQHRIPHFNDLDAMARLKKSLRPSQFGNQPCLYPSSRFWHLCLAGRCWRCPSCDLE